MHPREAQLLELCQDVLEPLVRADGGELYVTALAPDALGLHLAGTCAGCPGISFTSRGVLAPLVREVAPEVRLSVPNGARIPDGARRIEPRS